MKVGCHDPYVCGTSIGIGCFVAILLVIFLVWKISLCIKARTIGIDMDDFMQAEVKPENEGQGPGRRDSMVVWT